MQKQHVHLVLMGSQLGMAGLALVVAIAVAVVVAAVLAGAPVQAASMCASHPAVSAAVRVE